MSFLSRFLIALLVAVTICASSPSLALAAPGANNVQATAMFRRAGLLGAKTSITPVWVLPPFKKLPATLKTLVDASNPGKGKVKAQQASRLLFNFTGYSDDQKANLRDFVTTYYNTLVSVWGDPAPAQLGKTVQVVGNSTASDAGYAAPTVDTANKGGGGFIFYRYQNNSTLAVNRFNFARLLLLSFWGPYTPTYNFNEAQLIEPWVYGMSDAAALQISYIVAKSPTDFNPTELTLDFLPIYDLLNRPELGNAFIYSPLNADGSGVQNESSMSLFRLPMAMDAFVKVAVENPDYFKQFNTQLYASTSPRVAVSPDQLKSIAASAVPTVEGLGFQDWARRQYVLDSTVTTGAKLYPAIFPDPATAGDPRPGFLYYVESFTTNAQGQSIATAPGYGSIRAYDALGNDVTSLSGDLRSSNILDFVNTDFVGEASGGVGFDALPSGAQQRLELKFRNGNVESTAYFPFGVVGTTTSTSTFYGATVGPLTSTVALQSGSVSETVPLTLGAFTATQSYVSGARVQTTLTVNGTTFKRNTAWLVPVQTDDLLSVAFLLEAQSGTNGTFTVTAPAGTDKLRMVSFPFFPTESDEAKVLGVAPESLQMARYRPNLAPAQRVGDNLVFGIDGNRHEIYPNITQPIAPGRGYWLATGTGGLSKTAQGQEPPTDQTFEVPLLGGWNQFGVPFNRTFAPAAVQVRYGGFAPVTLDVAVARGWVAPGIWRWLPGGGYERADAPGSGDLQPYEGYFVFAGASNGIALVFQPSAEATAAVARTGWSVPLLASSSKGRDSANRFGISSDLSVAKPPTATRRISLRFEDASKGTPGAAASAGAGFAEAFLPQIGAGAVWHAIVDGTDKSERVTVSWGDLSGVPSNLQVTLRDETAKKNQILLSGGSYSFTSNGKARHLTLTVQTKPKSGKSHSSLPSSVHAS